MGALSGLRGLVLLLLSFAVAEVVGVGAEVVCGSARGSCGSSGACCHEALGVVAVVLPEVLEECGGDGAGAAYAVRGGDVDTFGGVVCVAHATNVARAT